MIETERVLVACPTCTQRIRTLRILVGKKIRCPTCWSYFVVEPVELVVKQGATASESATGAPSGTGANPLLAPPVSPAPDKAPVSVEPQPVRSLGSMVIPKQPMPTPNGVDGRRSVPLLRTIQILVYLNLMVGASLGTVVSAAMIERRAVPLGLGLLLLLYVWASATTLAVVCRLAVEVVHWLAQRRDTAVSSESRPKAIKGVRRAREDLDAVHVAKRPN